MIQGVHYRFHTILDTLHLRLSLSNDLSAAFKYITTIRAIPSMPLLCGQPKPPETAELVIAAIVVPTPSLQVYPTRCPVMIAITNPGTLYSAVLESQSSFLGLELEEFRVSGAASIYSNVLNGVGRSIQTVCAISLRNRTVWTASLPDPDSRYKRSGTQLKKLPIVQ